MRTERRDALMKFFKEAGGSGFHSTTFLTSNVTKGTLSDTGAAARRLTEKKILIRQSRSGTNEHEYAAGPRLDWGLKFIGKRFPYKQPNRKSHRDAEFKPVLEKAAPPTSGASAGLVIVFNGEAHAIKLDEAKAIYEGLHMLFGEK